MTYQEAYEVLDTLQISNAPDLREAVEMAKAALKNQDRKYEPLTQEELREMVTQWVWVVVNNAHDGERFQSEGWALVATPAVVAYLDQFLPTAFYGRKFVAYRYKPV